MELGRVGWGGEGEEEGGEREKELRLRMRGGIEWGVGGRIIYHVSCFCEASGAGGAIQGG